jgi:Rad3-related DNA helicase
VTLVNYFPWEQLRPVQQVAAEKIERAIHEAAGAPLCIVLNMPTGAGKSPLAVALAAWADSFGKRSMIAPPDGPLQSQYQRDYPGLSSLWAAKHYRCKDYKQTCAATKKSKKAPCKECPHTRAVERAKRGVALMNPYTLLSYRRKKDIVHPEVLIIDEAHKIVAFQMGQAKSVKIWKHQFNFPMDMQTSADLVRWLDNSIRTSSSPLLKRAKELVVASHMEVFIEKKHTSYRNKEDWCLEIRPLTARYASPVLWPPSRVKTLVLMSATINPNTVRELGLDRLYKIVNIECDSPIPHAARPVYYKPVASMSYATREVGLRAVAHEIGKLLDKHADSGFVHATYADAEFLRPLLTQDRVMWHDSGTKQSQLQDFEARAGTGAVLVGSGMREGIDLQGAKAHWQVITKINFPNLSDTWIEAKAAADPEWYDAQAVQELLQAVGRVCRGPDDFGTTYILDAQFERLFHERHYMFPTWFRDALRLPEGK